MGKNTGIKVLIAILIILIVVTVGLSVAKIMGDKNLQGNIQVGNKPDDENKTEVIEVKEVQTFKGTDRPIAVMIDNHKDAMPHSGLNDAYLVYEIIVEGGESRLMALFKGVDVDKIGPVRSSRHYFLDYALENDAIYAHFGWSPQAQSDISKLGVNNINGIYYDSAKERTDSALFWRTKEKYAPHNAMTNTSKLLQIANKLGYRTTSTKKSVLKYVVEPVELKGDMQATKVTIPYSDSNTVKYEYDENSQKYVRYSKGIKETDMDTKETVMVKNIIVVKCSNWTLDDGSGKGRQTIDNIKTLKGYYITNGKAIEITAEKSSRSSQTVYKDLDGNEIEVNDGNTFIQICPLNSKVKIEPGVVEETTTNTNTVNE